MDASDVMTRTVITVTPGTAVREIAALMVENHVSALPVVEEDGRVVGIVSDGDLIGRVDAGGAGRRSWWLSALAAGEGGERFLRGKGGTARDVMTSNPITITEDTPLPRIAALLERHHIKRVPVVRDGVLVGIVSRANLLRGFAFPDRQEEAEEGVGPDDRAIRDAVHERIDAVIGMPLAPMNVLVGHGHVQVWGVVESEAERAAVAEAVAGVAGVTDVENNLEVMGVSPRG